MIKFSRKLLIAVSVFLILLGLFAVPVLGVGVSASASQSTVKPGDEFTVTVKFKGTNIMGAEANFSYDSSLVKYLGGDNTSDGKIVLYTSASDASSLSCKIKFKALKDGSAKISITCTESYDSNLNSLSGGSSSVTVKIAASSGGSQNTQKPHTTPKPTSTPKPNIPITIDGVPHTIISTLPNDVQIPDGFSLTECIYNDQTVAGLQNEQGFTLLYIADANGENARFHIYETASDTYIPFVCAVVSQSYIILVPDELAELPEGYNPGLIDIDGNSVHAWLNADGGCILYACDDGGVADFFEYDTASGSFMRYVFPTPEPTPEPTSEPTPEPTPVPTPTPTSPTGLAALSTLEKCLGGGAIALAAGCIVLGALLIRASKKARVKAK